MLKKILIVSLFLITSLSYSDSQWIKTTGPNTQYISSLLLYGNSLFAATTDGIYVSSNNGTTWVLKNNGINTTNNTTYCLITAGNKILCGSDSGVYVSSNNGDSWTRKNNGIPVGYARKINAFLLYNGTNIYAGTDRGVYLSTNNGESWVARDASIDSYIIYSFTVKDNNIFAGTDKKVFRSSDAGLSWVTLSTGFPVTHTSAKALVTMGPNIVVGLCCGAGAYLSHDNGERWGKIHDMTANVFVSNGNNIIAGAIEGVLVSTDNGATWTERNEGLQYLTTTALAYNATKIFAGVELYVWYRPVGDLIGVNKISSEVPVHYSLSQNYPNPFNPKTIINYQLAMSNNVRLIIYDVMGREAAMLVNQKQNAGTYEIEWNASTYPSGVYFYKLEAGGFVMSKKMVLIK
ncbi:MAG: T9SS C-terminal target domain-containing protein [Ignavibacteriae bacterium]|nr:MAG: T9SS C-terminal target domain-containing protein [Ignavibacteriota bacterium]